MSNSQLKSLIETLEDHNVPYWLDNGTLLGLKRENRLLEQDFDSDIDISIKAKNESTLVGLIEPISENYNIKTRSYRRLRNSYKLSPIDDDKRVTYIKLFFEVNGHFFTPSAKRGSCNQKYKLKLESLLDKMSGLSTPSYVMRKENHLFQKYKFGGFWIPQNYFNELDTLEYKGMDTNIPSNVKGYLEFRYGDDWQTPKKDWSTWENDGGFLNQTPNQANYTELIKKQKEYMNPDSLHSKLARLYD